MVKGIYTYQKDHTAESTIFTPWSKSIIPFPSLHCKIQAFKDEKRQSATLPWNNGGYSSIFHPTQNPEKSKKSEKACHLQNKDQTTDLT